MDIFVLKYYNIIGNSFEIYTFHFNKCVFEGSIKSHMKDKMCKDGSRIEPNQDYV
jgi:hypothetical protein